jgi:hypothetical protein
MIKIVQKFNSATHQTLYYKRLLYNDLHKKLYVIN